MAASKPTILNARMEAAIQDLKATILNHYPGTRFRVEQAGDDPEIVHLIAETDVEDPDEVGDLVVDRVVRLIAEEQIPLHVIPVRGKTTAASATRPHRDRDGIERTSRLIDTVLRG